jgi:hypothetical protein
MVYAKFQTLLKRFSVQPMALIPAKFQVATVPEPISKETFTVAWQCDESLFVSLRVDNN